MPTVKMDRITVIGLKKERIAVIEALMRLGVMDIDQKTETVEKKLVSKNSKIVKELSTPVETDRPQFELDELSRLMSRLQTVITACARMHPIKKPMFSAKRMVSVSQFDAAVERQSTIQTDLNHFEDARTRIGEIDSQIIRLQSTAAMLTPWAALPVDLSFQKTQKTHSYLGTFKSRNELEKLNNVLADEAPESITSVLSEDETGLHVHVITLRTRESFVLSSLRRFNFAFLPIQDESATPRELLDRILQEQSELRLSRELEVARMDKIADKRVDFEMYHDYLQMAFDKQNVLRQLESTDQTFYLQGWVPNTLTASVETGLAQKFTIAFNSRDALPEESYPILLENHKLIKPYEVVVEMFNPPLPGEMDPTPVMAPFYFLFFGMMLSDVGYGLILSGLCALALYKFKVKGQSRMQFMLFFQCGLSSIFWGFMFGGFFGDMLSVITSGRIVLSPLWFDPLKEPTRLMLWSAIFGVLHLFAGMASKAYMLFKSGHGMDAVLDVFPWYLAIVGLLLSLAGIGKPFSGYAAIAGSVVIVLFAARDTKNPIARVGKGIYTLYGITAYFGDILSYSRVLALVLATSVIAMVVNKIGFLGGPSVTGMISFTLVAIIGHSINFALSALSAYIHTSRLQFVEFFGKFYEGGGRLWKPQKLTARYIQIERETVADVKGHSG